MEGMTMTETERILREQFPDPESQERISFCFREANRAALAQDDATREDIRRAAEGRRVLG
jgi:hypothetical protein